MTPTQSDIYQMLYWYNWFSWCWAQGCSKHAENRNKHTEKNCASSWSFAKNSADRCILFLVNKQWTTNTWNIQHLKYNCCTTVTESISVCSNSATRITAIQDVTCPKKGRGQDLTKENSSYAVKVFHTISKAQRSRKPKFQRVNGLRFALLTNIWFRAGTRDFSLLQSVRKRPWPHPDSYSASTGGSAQGERRQKREADH
jgi:hypothetical protein